jgi:hypothetical protein
MRKSSRIKVFVVMAACIAVLSMGLFACSSGSGSSASSSGSASDLEATYPLHTENATDDGPGLASYHMALGQDCTSCHTGDLNAQVAELEESTSGEEPPLSSSYYMDSQTCLDCHGGTWENLAQQTADLGDYNPHDSIHGTIENCNECHKGHSAQVDTCSECHDNGGQTMKGNN